MSEPDPDDAWDPTGYYRHRLERQSGTGKGLLVIGIVCAIWALAWFFIARYS